MIEYSKSEYADLVNQCPPYNMINDLNFILISGHAFNDSSISDFQQGISKKYPEMSKLLYEIPLEEIPLLLNHENPLVKAIVTWRLRVAK